MAKAKAIRPKVEEYLPLIKSFEEAREAFCKLCAYGSLPNCPLKGGEVCLRICTEKGVFP